MRTRRGTNQYQAKRFDWSAQGTDWVGHGTRDLVIYLATVVFLIASFSVHKLVSDYRDRMERVTIVTQAHADTTKPFIDNPTSEQEQIIADIKAVFGADADKAFQLLSCENHALNPNAMNINDDEWHSRDLGVFQINNHWQGVTNEAFLRDYQINIRMAYSIYSRDGHSFKLWTCGKKLGL